MTNRNLTLACALLAVAIGLVAVMLSGVVEVVLIVALAAAAGACVAVMASNNRRGSR